MTEPASDWAIECSDDERFTDWTEEDGQPLPPAGELERLYARVESGDLPELAWRCLGRRPLHADTPTDDQAEAIQLPDMSDFDFGSDDFAQPVTTPRRQPGAAPRGSAKKKSTSFDKILKNMKRTRELEAKEASEASATETSEKSDGC